jgi:hypothetical protein
MLLLPLVASAVSAAETESAVETASAADAEETALDAAPAVDVRMRRRAATGSP